MVIIVCESIRTELSERGGWSLHGREEGWVFGFDLLPGAVVVEAEVLKAATPVVLNFYSEDGAACKALIPRYGAVAQTPSSGGA